MGTATTALAIAALAGLPMTVRRKCAPMGALVMAHASTTRVCAPARGLRMIARLLVVRTTARATGIAAMGPACAVAGSLGWTALWLLAPTSAQVTELAAMVAVSAHSRGPTSTAPSSSAEIRALFPMESATMEHAFAARTGKDLTARSLFA